MKYIVIGLGNFGASIAEKLTQMGNEVIGVDNQIDKVDTLKHKITHTICLNCTDISAVSTLPLKDTDAVIISIGEDMGANIMATALMKQLKVKRLISRAVSTLQKTVLQAMGIDEIILPEEEAAKRWAKKLSLSGMVNSYELNEEYSVVEVNIPKHFDNKTIGEIELRNKHNILVLATIRPTQEKSILDIFKKTSQIDGIASAETILKYGDTMVLYGRNKDIRKLFDE